MSEERCEYCGLPLTEIPQDYCRYGMDHATAKIAQLETALAAAEERERWIPVAQGEVPIYAFRPVQVVTNQHEIVTAHIEHGEWYQDYWSGHKLKYTVTHWRDLPQLPEPPTEAK